MKDQPVVLIVDDEPRNLKLLQVMLRNTDYSLETAENGREALQQVEALQPDLILLDVMMPEMDGFQVAAEIRKNPEYARIPIVMVTALRDTEDRVKAIEAGADDFLSKPVEKTELRARIKSLLQVKAYHDHMLSYQETLEKEVAARTADLRRAMEQLEFSSLETILRLSKAAEYKDEDTGGHIQRMSHFALLIAQKIGMDREYQQRLLYAAPMHDIGKIGIPDRILLKPGKLDEEEWKIMRQHTQIGKNILAESKSDLIRFGEEIACTHHEKWDGSGYPNGLKGEDIPLSGRITAIADVFDALTSERPYKPPFSVEKSIEIMQQGRGSHFDARLLDVFLGEMDQVLEIRREFADTDESKFLQLASDLTLD